MNALNPVRTIESQIVEALEVHDVARGGRAKLRTGELLESVGIPRERGERFPHELSGGMRQRGAIAMALVMWPFARQVPKGHPFEQLIILGFGAAASSIGADLPRLGLRLALESRRPAKVLAWAERLRANALRLPPVRPPADKQLRELQTQLRRATTDSRTSDQTRLEAAIRSRDEPS